MYYKNARIFGPDLQFHMGAFQVKGGLFGQVLPAAVPKNAVDLHGATVIPGLVDIHTHGVNGMEFTAGDAENLTAMARYFLSQGVTSILPTAMTAPFETLEKAFAQVALLTENAPTDCARLLGVRMEGPYLSPGKKGAQNEACLKAPDAREFQKLYDHCGGCIRMVDLAPELPGAADFAEAIRKLCAVSVAHTDADYETAKIAFSKGATNLTHLFNAMPAIHHRNPGVIAAAAENPQVRAELICDGIHVHPAAVRLAFSLFGGHRMILISDSGPCCGLPEGSSFWLGGQKAVLEKGAGRLPDGTLACCAIDLYQVMVNAIFFGIEESDAVRAATYNPACAVHMQDRIGSIAPGKLADFIICRRDYTGKRVFLGGKEIH